MTEPPADSPAPAPRPEEPELLDEELLDGEDLAALPRPPVRRPPPEADPALPDEVQQPVDPRDLLTALAHEDPGEQEEDLLDPGEPPALVDEARAAPAWLADDGLARDEQDLVERPPAGGGPLRAGAEEYAVLVDLSGVVVPATLATGMAGSVLSAPLVELQDGRVRLRLGPETVEGDPRGLATRVRLGPLLLPVTLRLVEGPSPRLVLGRDLLAGHVLVDPGARHLLERGASTDDGTA